MRLHLEMLLLFSIVLIVDGCKTNSGYAYNDCFNEPTLREDLLRSILNSENFNKAIKTAQAANNEIIIYDSQTAIFGLEREFYVQDVKLKIIFGSPLDSLDSALSNLSYDFVIEDVSWMRNHIYIETNYLNMRFDYLFKIQNCNAELLDERFSIY